MKHRRLPFVGTILDSLARRSPAYKTAKEAALEREKEIEELQKQMNILQNKMTATEQATANTRELLKNSQTQVSKDQEEIEKARQARDNAEDQLHALTTLRENAHIQSWLNPFARATILETTARGNIFAMKEGPHILKGYNLKDLKGKSWTDFLFPVDRRIVADEILRIKTDPTRSGFNFHTGIIISGSQEGLYSPYFISLKVGRDAGGEVAYMKVNISKEKSFGYNSQGNKRTKSISIPLVSSDPRRLRTARHEIEEALERASQEKPYIFHLKQEKPKLTKEFRARDSLLIKLAEALENNNNISLLGLARLDPYTYTSLRTSLSELPLERLGLQLTPTYTRQFLAQFTNSPYRPSKI